MFTADNSPEFPPSTARMRAGHPSDVSSGPEDGRSGTWRPEYQKPDYPVPYGPATTEDIVEVLQRIHRYLEANTPAQIVHRQTGEEITDFAEPEPEADLEPGVFRLICYEWGVTLAGMLRASEVTRDARFGNYVGTRLQLIADRIEYFRGMDLLRERAGAAHAFRPLVAPSCLDDVGSLCAAMIRAHRAKLVEGLSPLVESLIDYIMHRQFRLADGTFARNRPLACALWLDDLYMSVPALAQMAVATGRREYFDEAVRQVRQFAARLFNPGVGLYHHGWVEGMEPHPEFRWARANGWALLAKTDLLDVLPRDHAGHAFVLDLLRQHVRALAAHQGGTGLWHQLLDRPDSYFETSASAIFTYCLARAINRGWIDPLSFGPMTQVAWSAVSARVNAKGQVEGTCVGSGMAFDPMFYHHRPTSPLAAHGYGPMLLAGAEMIRLVESGRGVMHDGAIHFGPALEDA